MISFLGLDVRGLIEAVGYLGILGIIFAESGLFIGFFLPGDSLLFTAGVFLSPGVFFIFFFCFFFFFFWVFWGTILDMLLAEKLGRRFSAAKILFYSTKTTLNAPRFFMKNTAQKLLCSPVFCRLSAHSRRFWPGSGRCITGHSFFIMLSGLFFG